MDTILVKSNKKKALFNIYHLYIEKTLKNLELLNDESFLFYLRDQKEDFSKYDDEIILQSIVDFRKNDGDDLWPEFTTDLLNYRFLDKSGLDCLYNKDFKVIEEYDKSRNSFIDLISDMTDNIQGTNSIEGIINNYIHRIFDIEVSILDLLPILNEIEEKNTSKIKKELKELLNVNLESEFDTEDKFINGIYDYIKNITRLNQSLRTNHSNVVMQSLFFNLFSTFDAYTGELLNFIYRNNHNLLYKSNKQYSIKEIINTEKKEDLILLIIEDEIDSIRRESYIKQFDNMEKRFDVKLKSFDNWSQFVEISQRRNLLMHCDGKVSNQYLSICKNNGVKTECKLGDYLYIDKKYLLSSIKIIQEVIFKLGQTLWRKIFYEEINSANKHIMNFAFEMLIMEKYTLAETMLEYGLSLPPKQLDCDADKKIMIINYCIALSSLGRKDQVVNVLESEDFSSCSIEFKLAKETLLSNYEKTYDYMKKVGKNGDFFNEKAYMSWPLFNDLRKETKFPEIFKEIFNKDFTQELAIGYRGLS